MDIGPKRNLKLRYSLLAAAVFLAMAAWSGGWFYMRAELEKRLDMALQNTNRTGNTIACADRTIAGFPFRFEVSCAKPLATANAGAMLSLDRLDAVALVYNPWHIIFDAFGPMEARDPLTGTAITAKWTSARSSVLLSGSAARQIDVVFDDLAVSSPAPVLNGIGTGHLEFHARPVPEQPNAVEGFLSAKNLNAAQLNNLAGHLDGRLHIRVENGIGLLSGMPLNALPRAEDGSLPFDVAWFSLTSGDTEVTAHGTLKLTVSGTVSGKLSLGIYGLNDAKNVLAALFPEGSTAPESLIGAAIALGKPKTDENKRQFLELPLTLEEGSVRVGMVPLGITIPPLAAGAGS